MEFGSMPTSEIYGKKAREKTATAGRFIPTSKEPVLILL